MRAGSLEAAALKSRRILMLGADVGWGHVMNSVSVSRSVSARRRGGKARSLSKDRQWGRTLCTAAVDSPVIQMPAGRNLVRRRKGAGQIESFRRASQSRGLVLSPLPRCPADGLRCLFCRGRSCAPSQPSRGHLFMKSKLAPSASSSMDTAPRPLPPTHRPPTQGCTLSCA